MVADYYSCAYNGVKYLVSKGCKHIGLINGNMELVPYKERYQGYQNAIKECGLQENVSKSRVPQYNNFTDGLKGTNYLLDKNPQIDGILSSLDMQGLGALRALKEREIAVPEQVKVISLTGQSIGSMLETTMTSMEIPALEIGKKSAEIVVGDIERNGGAIAKAQHIKFDPALIVRETT